jgi:predicted RNA-binding protein with PIN domain
VKPKLASALRDLQKAESELAAEYRTVGERHAAEHDVFHICHTLASQSAARADRIAGVLESGAESPPENGHESTVHSLVAAARRTASQAISHSAASSAVLLADLRHLYSLTADCEAQWLIVGQGAKASREAALIDLTSTSCEEVVGQMRWIKTKLKLAAPQAVAVG